MVTLSPNNTHLQAVVGSSPGAKVFPGGDRLPSHFDLESGDAALNLPTRKQVKELIVLDASARVQDSYDSWMQAQEFRILTSPGCKRKNSGFLRFLEASARMQDSYDSWMQAQEFRILAHASRNDSWEQAHASNFYSFRLGYGNRSKV